MFTLADIVESTESEILSKGEETFVSASIDTRTIGKGDIFFPLKGTRRDGHDFVKEALTIASGAVISKELNIDFSGKTVIKVKDTLLALQSLAKLLRGRFSGKVIAVIGSNGKTTTKELLSTFLSKKYRVLKTEGNLNNAIGVPLCVSKIKKDTEIMILELGTNRKGDIKELCDIVFPNWAIITNIGYEHIEGFGSLEGVREGELEILPYVSTVIVNGDDKFLMEGLKGWKGRVITFGCGRDCDFRAENIEFSDDGVTFSVNSKNARFNVRSPLVGMHNVYNSMAALAAALNLDVSPEEIRQSLESFTPVKMRGEILRIRDAEILFDAYNANPSSMRAAISELARRKKNRVAVAVLGDMLELGPYSENAHEELGKLLKELGIECFIGVGKFIKNALRYVSGPVFDDACQAGEFLKKNLKGNEVVLIKGSRSMKMEKIIDILGEG